MQPKKILVIILIITGAFFTSCEKLLNPDPQNFYAESRFFKDPPFSEGVLLSAYTVLPSGYTFDEIASDDAVTNLTTSNYLRMDNGEWSSQFDPMASWSTAYKAIYNVNFFLTIVDKVQWSWTSAAKSEYFRQRFTGEAYGMRAWWNFELLKCHGGKIADGSLLGVILLDKPMDNLSGWESLKRSSYDACVQMIYDDIDKAMAILPLDYANITGNVDYNSVYTPDNKGRMCGRILKALKSRVALHVASQAFGTTQAKWEAAADAAAKSLADIGGVTGLSATGHRFYLTSTDADIIWRGVIQTINTWESSNFPPSMLGTGRTNPSQNLVDAFPMANGYPIAVAPAYNPQNPYVGRDPRLSAYIVYKGNTIGTTVINTNTEDAQNGLNKSVNATRSGYYLKKLLRENVNLNPPASSQQHFKTHMRYTEIFLNYAEAANEAWGPAADPRGYGFTPTSIIAAIRKRGGITQPDAYLATQTTQAAMRDLIRNERRIELCFEGFRFWDLRRWNANLTETAKGIQITNNVYTVIDVENRAYKPYQIYGPIPYSDLLKSTQLIQNDGWSN